MLLTSKMWRFLEQNYEKYNIHSSGWLFNKQWNEALARIYPKTSRRTKWWWCRYIAQISRPNINSCKDRRLEANMQYQWEEHPWRIWHTLILTVQRQLLQQMYICIKQSITKACAFKFATNIHKFTVMATNGTHKEDFHNGLISQITIDSGFTITYIRSTIWSWQEHD